MNYNNLLSKWTFKYIKANVLYSVASAEFENLLGHNMPLIIILYYIIS
jgi:hypothetical protein